MRFDVSRILVCVIPSHRPFLVIKFCVADDEYEHILSPMLTSSPLGAPNAPSYEELSSSEFEVLLKELEPDIRSADRDLREIQTLDKRGVSGSGRLTGELDTIQRAFSHKLTSFSNRT